MNYHNNSHLTDYLFITPFSIIRIISILKIHLHNLCFFNLLSLCLAARRRCACSPLQRGMSECHISVGEHWPLQEHLREDTNIWISQNEQSTFWTWEGMTLKPAVVLTARWISVVWYISENWAWKIRYPSYKILICCIHVISQRGLIF